MDDTQVAVERIDRLIGAGIGLHAVEKFIDGLALDPDEQAALWLLAWSELDHPACRRSRSNVIHQSRDRRSRPAGQRLSTDRRGLTLL